MGKFGYRCSEQGLTALDDSKLVDYIQEIDCSGNPALTAISTSVGKCKELESLVACGCSMTSIPAELTAAKLTLKVLNLAQNRLSELPSALGELTSLTEVDFSSNALTTVPDVVLGGWSKVCRAPSVRARHLSLALSHKCCNALRKACRVDRNVRLPRTSLVPARCAARLAGRIPLSQRQSAAQRGFAHRLHSSLRTPTVGAPCTSICVLAHLCHTAYARFMPFASYCVCSQGNRLDAMPTLGEHPELKILDVSGNNFTEVRTSPSHRRA